ncbi:HORMA-1 domain-containing protein [Herpetosiphon geysericola]|uniref:HORMA-1 domain-containing protein n=1 Tax=Herpetosiphon geysericola TaxID=70996 RepID=UPI001364AF30
MFFNALAAGCKKLGFRPTWNNLTQTEQENFKKRMPFYRGSAPESQIDGYMTNDRTYSAGGRALDRSTVRSY